MQEGNQTHSFRNNAERIANDSYTWYKSHAIRARRLYRATDVAVMLLSAAIPTILAITPDARALAALMGSLIAVVSGLRPVFHWQENYLRFSEAREAVNRERRLFQVLGGPYADDETRDETLVRAISTIEQSEMSGWLKIASNKPGQ